MCSVDFSLRSLLTRANREEKTHLKNIIITLIVNGPSLYVPCLKGKYYCRVICLNKVFHILFLCQKNKDVILILE